MSDEIIKRIEAMDSEYRDYIRKYIIALEQELAKTKADLRKVEDGSLFREVVELRRKLADKNFKKE